MTTASIAKDHRHEVVPFTAGDGFSCNLIHVWGAREPDKGPVLLVHGAGVRAQIFMAPVARNLVDCLIEEGYDVWLENWRASIDFQPNQWTLDQAAKFDHPRAVAKVLEATGTGTLDAIIHCQGSTSFTMSAVAGLVPQVRTIVSNAVSLHPVIPLWSRLKLRFALPVLRLLTPYLNPAWGLEAKGLVPKLINGMVGLTHFECSNAVCKQVSFTYGAGFPALWRHENLDETTHEWIKHEFAAVPLRFFYQIRKCVVSGNLVSMEHLADLPADYADHPPETQARFAFFAGQKNRCFSYQSQVLAHQFFSNFRPNYHTLHLLPTYSHLDVFLGEKADREVFPLILEELANPGFAEDPEGEANGET